MLTEEDEGFHQTKNDILYKLSQQQEAKLAKLTESHYQSTCTFKPNLWPQPNEIRQFVESQTHFQRELEQIEHKKRSTEIAKREMLFDSESKRPLFQPLIYTDQKRNRPAKMNVINNFFTKNIRFMPIYMV